MLKKNKSKMSCKMYRFFKRAFLYISKVLGLFLLARWITRHGLRIVCYHGISVGDEHQFSPKTYITTKTLEKRIEFLIKRGFRFLGLGEAIARLDSRRLPTSGIVITFDDGFRSAYRKGFPILWKHGVPITLYLTTYYCVNSQPIFNLVVQYMFWKFPKDFPFLDLLNGVEKGDIISNVEELVDVEVVKDAILRYGVEECSAEEREALIRELSSRLGLDYKSIVERDSFRLLTLEEAREAAARGVDVQLHTHRHCLPANSEVLRQEIWENRFVLERITRRPLVHFCYPSGRWSQGVWPLLESFGVKTAVTCEAGLNYPNTPRLALKRFLDGEDVSQLEFEAEVAGYMHVLRKIHAGFCAVLSVVGIADLFGKEFR